MKKLLTLLLLATLFVSCSSDDDNESRQEIKITKITVENKSGIDQNCILSYKKENTYKKVSSILLRSGSIGSVSIENLQHSDLYIFTDYASFSLDGKDYWRKIDTTYKININKENIIQIPELNLGNLIAVDISDNTQFPID